MKLFGLILFLAAAGCSRPQPTGRGSQQFPIAPQTTGSFTLTTSGTGAASLSGDPTNGYLLNVPYFAGFLTTGGTAGASTVNNGVLNIPNYATSGGVTLPSGSIPGQSLIVGTGGTMMASANPGIAEAMASPVATTVAPSCGTTSSIGDLGQTFVLQAGATVTVPSATCSSAVFYFFSQGASTFTSTQTLQIYNGAAYTTGTTYASTAGQYITLVRSKAANTWIMAIGNAAGGGGGGMVPPGSTGITSLTTTGTNGTASYSSSSGVLNIPDYSAASSGITLPSGALPGQVLAVGAGGTAIAGSPGLSDSANSPLTTTMPFTPSCGTVDTGDRSHIFVVTAATPITIPVSTVTACSQAVFYFLMRAAATIQRSGTDTFDIYNGATALAAQTSYTAAAGQYITVANGNGTTWHLMVGYAGPSALNIQQHYFAPDFTVSGSTVVSSVGQGAGPITALSTPQLLCNYYFVIDTPTANQKIQAHIYRTTGAVPTLGSPPGGSDVQVAIVTFPYAATGALTTVGGAIFDLTGAVTGTAYNYYLAVDSAVAQNVNIHSQSYLQVAEAP